ncbi:MAG: hypothetical protein GY805_18930 [Chloroflexi bacterium]|nr:hypothetical protein [Chloroflexota bacterium]
MFEYLIFGIMIVAGLIIAWQGIQAMQGKRNVKMKSFERAILQVLSPKEQSQTMKTLGVIRFIYGLVFLGMGIYFLVSIFA